MNINLKVTNMELTPAIEDYVEKKISTADKFFAQQKIESESVVDVEIGQSTKHHQSGDIFFSKVLYTKGGKEFSVEAEKDDLYAAIDASQDELVRQLNDNKTKKRDLMRRGGKVVKRLLRGWSA